MTHAILLLICGVICGVKQARGVKEPANRGKPRAEENNLLVYSLEKFRIKLILKRANDQN